MDFATLLIQLLNSVQYGLLLFMLAAGLTLIFGIMGVVNLAHGSFYMLGAYLGYSLSGHFGSAPPRAPDSGDAGLVHSAHRPPFLPGLPAVHLRRVHGAGAVPVPADLQNAAGHEDPRGRLQP